jgi:dephospho-CoA kinase
MSKLVCIAGLPGSGKSVASDFFVAKGFQYLRFGQIVLDEVMKKGLEISEPNERKVREELRKKYGMAAMAILNLKKFKELLKKGDTIGDGLYSFEEYKVLKKEFGKNFITIAVYAPPEVRYKRLSTRVLSAGDKVARDRSYTREEAESRDYAELEKLNKGATIAMADYTILNTKDLEYFNKQLNEVEKEIESGKI